MTLNQLLPITRRDPSSTSHLFLGQHQTLLARSEETGGAFALIEEVVQAGLEPPRHTHTHEDESFYVLDGQLEFSIGEDTHPATQGDFVFLPRGLPHAFKLQTPTARLLVLLTPGGFERLFLSMATPVSEAQGPPEPAAFQQLLREAPEHGIRWDAPLQP